jgi:hypothetical protein
MEVEIKHLDVGSVVKIAFVLYAILGLIIGIVYLIVAVVFSGFLDLGYGARDSWLLRTAATGFGILLVPLLALLYGFLGAIGGLIFSLLYNVISRTVGGVRVGLKGETLGRLSSGE